MCVNYPTGVSPRHQVTIDGELSCNSFGYCKDGDHVVEDCTPGQYFDGGPGKFAPKSQDSKVPNRNNRANAIKRFLGACFPIDDIPCGTPCSNPCTTQPPITIINDKIDPRCAHHPKGVSPRHQVTIDDEISCTSFGYCKDGQHIIEDCTPGQYFDGGPGKFIDQYHRSM